MDSMLILNRAIEASRIVFSYEAGGDSFEGSFSYDGKGEAQIKFQRIRLSDMNAFESAKVFWGEINGELVTFLNAYGFVEKFNLAGYGSGRVTSKYVIWGSHVRDYQSNVVSKVWIDTEYKEALLDHLTPGEFLELSFPGDIPTNAPMKDEEHLKDSILFQFGAESIPHELKFSDKREDSFLTLQFHQKQPLSSVLKFVKCFQDLCSLGSGKPSGLITVEVLIDDDGVETASSILCDGFRHGSPDCKSLRQEEYFYDRANVAAGPGLQLMLEKYDDYFLNISIVTGLDYFPSKYLESHLIVAAVAAESLDARLEPKAVWISRSDFKKMKSTVREAFLAIYTEEEWERFSRMIQNKKTFKERMRTLVERLSSKEMDRFLPDSKVWAETLTKVRNKLVHEGKTPEENYIELIGLIYITKFIVRMNLLKELGVLRGPNFLVHAETAIPAVTSL